MLTEWLEFATEMAHDAGDVLREGFAQPHQTVQKTTQNDFVTETDQKAEDLIASRIQSTYPEHGLLGEEGGAYDAGDTEYRWVVDPLDGTTNFASGIPHFSVSIALCGVDGFPLVGVIYDPLRDELFSAVKAEGAKLNGVPISVSRTDILASSVLASGFPYDRWTSTENNFDLWRQFAQRNRGVRRMGSAALDLAYVATGRIDGYWEQKLNPWDVMAGILLVEEAGGRVTDYAGARDSLTDMKLRLVSSNGLIHDAMLTVIRDGDNAPRPE